MKITGRQANQLSQLRQVGEDWGSSYSLSLIENLVDEGDLNGELDALISLHFNSGIPRFTLHHYLKNSVGAERELVTRGETQCL